MIKYLAALLVVFSMTGSFAKGKVISHSQKSITLEFTLPESPAPAQEIRQRTQQEYFRSILDGKLTAQMMDVDGREYAYIDYPGAYTTADAGAPMLPYTVMTVAIPQGATVTPQFQITQQDEITNIDIVPAIRVNGLKEGYTIPVDEAIYTTAAPYPGQMIEVSEPYIHRRMQVVDVRVYPLQYHPAQHRLRVIEKMNIQLSISGGELVGGNPRFSKNEMNHLSSRLVNFQQAVNWAIDYRTTLQKSTVNYDLSIGEWYQIPITEEGIYQVTGSFLQSNGIDISSISTAMIQMFNYGGTPLSTNVAIARPADLNEIAVEVVDANGNGTMDPEDAIYFYGMSTQGWRYNISANRWDPYLHPYSFENYYTLTFNQNTGKRIPDISSPQLNNPTVATRFEDLYHIEEENHNILQSGLDWYWFRYQGTSQESSHTIRLPQSVLPDNAQFKSRLKGGSGSRYFDTPSTPYRYTFDININGANVVDNEGFTDEFSREVTRSITGLRGGDNEFQVVYSANQEGCFAFLDYLQLRVQRQFIAEDGFLKFYYDVTQAPVEFSISGLPSADNRIWDISDFANIRRISPLSAGTTVTFHTNEPQSTAKQYYVFSTASIKTVGEITQLENSPNLRNPDRKAKLILIMPDEFYDAAAGWEDLKETAFPNPIQTERVKLSEIYKEFSSGVTDPGAIRDFIKYAYENWGNGVPEDRPEYIQLLGDGSYDYRNIELADYPNRVPVFEITANNDISSRVTDNFYTAVNNSFNDMQHLDPQLAIGRLPANSTEDVENYLTKLRAYSESFKVGESDNGWQSVITFVADDECAGSSSCNEWFHLAQTENIIGEVPKKFDLSKIYLVDYDTQAGGLGRQKPKASADLLDRINRGTLLINFFGHGDPNTWAHEQVLVKARDLPLIQNGIKLPLWVAATCTWGQYDDPNIPSSAEEMVWSQSGGGIMSIAASRPSFAFENERFVENMFGHLFNDAAENQRSQPVGDAVVMSVGGRDNDQKYHVFGDVTLNLADPQHTIKIDRISSDTLKALSTVSVDASIYDASNNPISNFNGKAIVRVFDSVDSLNNLGVNYVYQGGTIFKGVVSVENGKIDNASFIVPKSIKYQDSPTGRISIYAWSDNLRDAAGFNDQLLFLGTESQVDDQKGPDISFSFPDQPDFFDGDFVGQQPTIVIGLNDDSGINLTGEVGHRIELTIDDNIKKDVTEFFVYYEDRFTEGELRYTLPALASGRHTLKISAWDNLNNLAEESVNFTTTSSSELTLANVVNWPNPMSGDTNFTFQFQSPNGSGEATVKVYTVSGLLIQELQDFAQPGFNKIYWDGRDRDGNILANGVYIYKIVINDGQETIEKIEKLAVAR